MHGTVGGGGRRSTCQRSTVSTGCWTLLTEHGTVYVCVSMWVCTGVYAGADPCVSVRDILPALMSAVCLQCLRGPEGGAVDTGTVQRVASYHVSVC